MFPRDSSALVMVSGGQDSVALLEMLAGGVLVRVGPAGVHALHVNHYLRGEESDRDEDLVRRHCSRLRVGLTVVHGAVDKTAGNVQEEARLVRRRAAQDVAEGLGCARIVLGHTLDDQAETLLYRIARYGGLAALRGMLPNDPPWVRPLLGIRRAETEAFCRDRGLEFAVDRGNDNPGYARTGLRSVVLPAWEQVLPGAAEAAARTAEVAAEAESALATRSRELGIDLEASSLEVPQLRRLPAALRRLALYTWLGAEGAAPTRRDVMAVEGLLASGGTKFWCLSGGRRAVREYERLYLDEADGQPVVAPPDMVLGVPGAVDWGGVRVCAERVERFCAPDPAREVYLDADAVEGDLLVRNLRPGDRMRPLGLGGTRRLQDVLTDLKIPAPRRALVPLVVSAGAIIWVCGLMPAEQGRITAYTKRLVRLSLE